MIHGNSNDPVLIKRIGLKIWSLRDEVENVVAKTLRANPEIKELDPETLAQIREEYAYKGAIENKANLSLVPDAEEGSSEGEDLEAEMAAAMGGEGEQSEEASDSPDEQSGEDLEAEMAAAMGGGDDAEAAGEQAASGPVKVIQRSSAIIPPSKISRGVTVLSELSMDSLYFFGGEKFMEGQSIVIEFQIPKRFVVNADVVYCRPFNIRSRIISDKKVSYRIVARFTFLKEGERTLLRQFIQSIEPEIPVAPIKKPKVESNDDGDDFDGLDGLDF